MTPLRQLGEVIEIWHDTTGEAPKKMREANWVEVCQKWSDPDASLAHFLWRLIHCVMLYIFIGLRVFS